MDLILTLTSRNLFEIVHSCVTYSRNHSVPCCFVEYTKITIAVYVASVIQRCSLYVLST